MATTIKLSPRLVQGTVLIQITAPAPETPTVLYSMTGPQIVADAAAWAGESGMALYGDLAAFYCIAANQRVTRNGPVHVVGRRYRFTVTAQRTSVSSAFGVTGRGEAVIPTGSGIWSHAFEYVATSTSHQLYLDIVQNNNPYIRSLTVELLPVNYDLAQFTLTRTDSNGIHPVRLLGGQEITDGTLIVDDAEAALTGPITYQLTSALGAVTTASTTLDGATGYRLAPALFPQWAVTLDLVTGYDASRTAASTVHDVIGRADPVVRLGAVRLRRGTLTVWCDSYPALLAALDVYRRGEVVQLRQPDYAGLDLYHIAIEVRESPYDEAWRRWRLEVSYVEVAAPRGDLMGSPSWTWDDLTAMFPTWDAVPLFFASWNAAQIGPTT